MSESPSTRLAVTAFELERNGNSALAEKVKIMAQEALCWEFYRRWNGPGFVDDETAALNASRNNAR